MRVLYSDYDVYYLEVFETTELYVLVVLVGLTLFATFWLLLLFYYYDNVYCSDFPSN